MVKASKLEKILRRMEKVFRLIYPAEGYVYVDSTLIKKIDIRKQINIRINHSEERNQIVFERKDESIQLKNEVYIKVEDPLWIHSADVQIISFINVERKNEIRAERKAYRKEYEARWDDAWTDEDIFGFRYLFGILEYVKNIWDIEGKEEMEAIMNGGMDAVMDEEMPEEIDTEME